MSRRESRKAVSAKRRHINELSELAINNAKAIEEGPKRKTWTKHDLRSIRPLTHAQEDMFHGFLNDYNICAYGSAGTGKTFLGLFLAFNELFQDSSKQTHIIIVRSAVATREIGFLPGSADEKMSVHEAPYKDILSDLFRKASTYEDMKAARLIHFMPTSFIRGTTWDNAIVVVDEFQNMTFHEINSVMTRLGKNSRIILLGDGGQNDLVTKRNEQSGFFKALQVIERMNEFSMVKFTIHDIVRSPFVKSWIQATEDVEKVI